MNKYTWKPIFSEETIRGLYCVKGMTQEEISRHLLVSRKAIQTLMRFYKINRRIAAKRNQNGKNNHSWKGDKAGYQALHLRVESLRGKTKKCSRCGTADELKSYDWANLSGNYSDPFDYERMCRSCHRKYDNARKK